MFLLLYFYNSFTNLPQIKFLVSGGGRQNKLRKKNSEKTQCFLIFSKFYFLNLFCQPGPQRLFFMRVTLVYVDIYDM